MTTAADDTAAEAAFEAFLAGRPVPEEAAGLAAFAGAVRATATLPGRPSAALAELLANGLLTDQPSPSPRTAPSAGSQPRRSRVRRRRLAMFFPALVAKFLSAGAVAQAASGAGVAVVVAASAGATGLLGADVQDTITSVVGVDSGDVTTQDDSADTGDETATVDPGAVDSTDGDTSVPVEEAFDPEAWVAAGPADDEAFGTWVSASAHNDELREWLRSQGMTFGSMVRGWANKKGLDDADLTVEGVDLDELTDEPTTEPVTDGTATDDDAQSDDTEVAPTQRGGGSGHGNGGDSGGGSGNGGGNSGRGRN